MEVGKKDNILTVIAPLKGTPAERASIRAGDKIIKIGSTLTNNLSVEEAVQKIRGKAGTTVTLSLFRDNGTGKPFDVTVTREIIQVPTIETEIRPDGIFVIRLFSFSEKSPQLFRDAVIAFAKHAENPNHDKLILDLRNNPGGYLEAAVDMASWFLPEGAIIVTEDYKKKGTTKHFRSYGYNVFTDKLKLIILVNEGSASASEILAGALKEHGKAILIGEKTFGKGSVQELVSITENTALKVTIARWLTPKGNSISEAGLKPDIEIIYKEYKDKKPEVDTQIERAVKYFKDGK